MNIECENMLNAGLDEAGIDGGGLFREFLSQLLKAAFDPNRGFFTLTRDQMLYPRYYVESLKHPIGPITEVCIIPGKSSCSCQKEEEWTQLLLLVDISTHLFFFSPSAAHIHPDAAAHYYFIGRMLGKVVLFPQNPVSRCV